MTTMSSARLYSKCSSCGSRPGSIEMHLGPRSQDRDVSGQLKQQLSYGPPPFSPRPLSTLRAVVSVSADCRNLRQPTNPGVGTADEIDVHGLIDANSQILKVRAGASANAQPAAMTTKGSID